MSVLAVTDAEALRNAHMHAALQRQTEELRRAASEAFDQARRDPLTGLGNRTALLEAA